MKIPLGLLLSSPELAEGKVLISPVDIKPHLKITAGAVLYQKGGKTPQPLDQIRQVLDKLKERAQRAGDSKVFMDAMTNMEKETTPYFTNNLTLVETNVMFVNVAFSDDLDWPDGKLFRLLATLYPHYYPEPDGKMSYTGLVKMLETKQVQFLNDISLLYNESLIVEYKTVLDRNKHILLREKLNRLAAPLKQTELFDATTSGAFSVSRNLFSYTKKFLYPADTAVDDAMMASPEVKALLAGDPAILYREPRSRQGIFLADNAQDEDDKLKGYFKKHLMRFVGETVSKSEAEASVKNLRPKFLIIGNLGADKTPDVALIKKIAQENAGDGIMEQPLNIFVLTPGKDQALEAALRSAGLTFFFSKEEILTNFDATAARLKSTLDLFSAPA
jgi:hypothetical protein